MTQVLGGIFKKDNCGCPCRDYYVAKCQAIVTSISITSIIIHTYIDCRDYYYVAICQAIVIINRIVFTPDSKIITASASPT